MNVFYEEDGGFKAGIVRTDQGGAFQVESFTGKRSKVKAASVLVEFKDPEPVALMRDAQLLASSIDLDFLWECAPPEEFEFIFLAREYFGHEPSAVESAALLFRLHGAPMYFYRKGRGRYRPATAVSLQAALASVERKRQAAVLQQEYVSQLERYELPPAVQARVDELLFKPDRASIEFKALEEACSRLGTTPARLFLANGGLRSAKEFHLHRFLHSHFPHGTDFPHVGFVASETEAPIADVEAFSIDDHTTTEIDDAFSVRRRGEGWRIGVHIAAPGLGIVPQDPIDQIARQRNSTVYMPGHKITMLPDELVSAYSLAEGRICPVVSLYLDVAGEDGVITSGETRLERVRISHNLRHNALDDVVSDESLLTDSGDYPCKAEIAVLWKCAQQLHADRQAARVASGLKPEGPNRPDYNFYIDDDERVEITERKRGSPLDKIVAEFMILTNSTWGKLLADAGIPGIYRIQQGFGPAGRVRMVTHPAPHQGLGVAQYAWCTSPLRRYVDLVNQWQLLACIDGSPPKFGKNDADLFSIISGFDASYAAYAEVQGTMERYWCLRWLEQHGVRLSEATVDREDWVRLPEIPLHLRVPGLPKLARGTRVELELLKIDLLDLAVESRLLAVIEEVDDIDPMADAALEKAPDELSLQAPP